MSIEDCREAVERTHGGSATFRETVRVVDSDRVVPFRAQPWECDVHVFDLAENPLADVAYAWAVKEGVIAAVLKIPPVDGPLAAVRVISDLHGK